MRPSQAIQKYQAASKSKQKTESKSKKLEAQSETKVEAKKGKKNSTDEKQKETPKELSKEAQSKKKSAGATTAPAFVTPSKKAETSKPAIKVTVKETVKEVVKEIAKETVEVKTEVNLGEAVEAAAEAGDSLKEETALQAEIAKEIEKEATHTSQLVRSDCSPVNTPRDKLIVEYAPLIKYISQKIAARLPANIELDDLMSSGVIGLMDAIDKYDHTRDNKFKTYAEFRIRGAILDELRAQDWVPRSVREKAKQLERAYQRIEQEKGRQATDEEVCQNLNISQQEYNDLLTQVRGVALLSVDDIANLSKADKRSIHGIGDNDFKSNNPFSEVSMAHLKYIIADAIRDLPEKQRLVLSLYYYEDLNLKEIGKVLDVTESRVSQLHTQAVMKLKARLKNNWDDFVAFLG